MAVVQYIHTTASKVWWCNRIPIVEYSHFFYLTFELQRNLRFFHGKWD
jgi:hypothetical protein